VTDPLTLDDLLNPDDADEALQALLTQMRDGGVPVSDWQEGAELLTLAEKTSSGLADLGATLPVLAKSGLLELCDDLAWATLLAKSAYGVDANAATFAVLHTRLSNATGSPYNITAGQLWVVTDPGDGRRWNSANAGTVTLPAGGTLDLDFRAEQAGALFNVLFSAPPTLKLATALPGVTLAVLECVDADLNPLGTYMTTAGAEAESLPQLKERCRTRWASLAFGGPAVSYVQWARDAAAAVKRVWIRDDNPDGPGTARVYVAGDGGAVGGADVTAVNAVIQARKPPTAIITVDNVSEDVVTLAATVECPTGLRTAARTQIYQALVAYQQDLAISNGAGKGKLLWSRVFEILGAPQGVSDVRRATVLLNGTADDYAPAAGHVAVLRPSDLQAGGVDMPSVTFVDPPT
jgi:hypothetical protein